jgi:hypothetical protein
VRAAGCPLVLLCAATASAAVLAGCGDSARHASEPSPATSITSPSSCGLTDVTSRQLARAQRDLAKLRTVASRQTRYTELGTTEMQLATGRYLDDLTTSRLGGIRVNRLIDLGAAVVSPYCGQCFQMLEASRPIPALAHSPHPCSG